MIIRLRRHKKPLTRDSLHGEKRSRNSLYRPLFRLPRPVQTSCTRSKAFMRHCPLPIFEKCATCFITTYVDVSSRFVCSRLKLTDLFESSIDMIRYEKGIFGLESAQGAAPYHPQINGTPLVGRSCRRFWYGNLYLTLLKRIRASEHCALMSSAKPCHKYPLADWFTS